ncbi:MAG: hypothetical protein GY928_22360 [Colwellia sp.]|nr:hypothetical protein [Colwellia sp.]
MQLSDKPLISYAQIEMTIEIENESNKIKCHILPLSSKEMGCELLLSEATMAKFGFKITKDKDNKNRIKSEPET